MTRLDNRVILLVDLYSAESTSNWLSAHFLTLISWRHVTAMLNDPDTNWPCVTRLKKTWKSRTELDQIGTDKKSETSDWNWAMKTHDLIVTCLRRFFFKLKTFLQYWFQKLFRKDCFWWWVFFTNIGNRGHFYKL